MESSGVSQLGVLGEKHSKEASRTPEAELPTLISYVAHGWGHQLPGGRYTLFAETWIDVLTRLKEANSVNGVRWILNDDLARTSLLEAGHSEFVRAADDWLRKMMREAV